MFLTEYIVDGRIVPEKVASLWAKHGLKPGRHVFLKGDPGDGQMWACIRGAILVESCGSIDRLDTIQCDGSIEVRDIIADRIGLDRRYMHGLEEGFLCVRGRPLADIQADCHWTRGFNDGLAVAKALGLDSVPRK